MSFLFMVCFLDLNLFIYPVLYVRYASADRHFVTTLFQSSAKKLRNEFTKLCVKEQVAAAPRAFLDFVFFHRGKNQ